MSETPRTDAAIHMVDVAFVGADGLSSYPGESIEPSFARELERELATAIEQRNIYAAATLSLREDRARLDWLESKTLIICREPEGSKNPQTWAVGPSGNFQIWSTRCQTAREAIDAARKAAP